MLPTVGKGHYQRIAICVKLKTFDIDLDIDVTGFRGAVLDKLRSVPYGTTISYSELASLAGNPQAARAAGNACAGNPVPIVIPCHRILASDGTLGGFGGGIEYIHKGNGPTGDSFS